MNKMTKKNIIYTLKTISLIYLLTLLINTMFFYGKFLHQTIFNTGLFGAAACLILTYDIDFSKLPKEKRGFYYLAVFVLILLCLYKLIHILAK